MPPRRNAHESPAQHDGTFRTNWDPPYSVEEWRQFGRTAADVPFTVEEQWSLEDARRMYSEQNGGNSPPMYHHGQGSGIPESQRIPTEVQESIDKANAEIDTIRNCWNRNREIQSEKIREWHRKKLDLFMARRQVRELQREIKELEEELEEFDQTYTGMEEFVQDKVEWITSMQDAFNP